MNKNAAIAVVGTFDSKGEEHFFLKECIEKKGFPTLAINVGTKSPSTFKPDHDLYEEIVLNGTEEMKNRDKAIEAVVQKARELVRALYEKGEILGIISAGGGTGTHLGTSIMRVLPVGIPKVMVSTVASRDMSRIVGTKDITMMHSVADILGVNSILGKILDKAAGAICGMAKSQWNPDKEKKRIALSMFGFITTAAEGIKQALEDMGYEVVAFHANGTGGMAMEELALEGRFHGILDLATHELADELKGGYCRGIGPERLAPVPPLDIPRLVVPGGLDCAVLEFTRNNIPEKYKHRKIFFYDFRSAIRLDEEETLFLARQLAEKLNGNPTNIKVLIPMRGWSEADKEDGPLYDSAIRDVFIQRLKKDLNPHVEIKEVDHHINDTSFAGIASSMMDEMLKQGGVGDKKAYKGRLLKQDQPYQKHIYWLTEDEERQLREALVRAGVRLKSAKGIVCTPLDKINKIASVAPEVWNGTCARQGSWYRSSKKQGLYLIVSAFPLEGYETHKAAMITESDFIQPRPATREEKEALVADLALKIQLPQEWQRVKEKEKGIYLRWARRLGSDVEDYDFLYLTHTANHANFIRPRFFVRDVNEIIPYSIDRSAHLCSSCVELFQILGGEYNKKLVAPCPGATIFARLKPDRFLLVEKS